MILRWIESYLKDRPQRVALDKILSRPRYWSCGVPQGSVLGLLLFSLYITPLEHIISAHGFDAMIYANDTHPYIFFMREGNRAVALENLSLRLDNIMSWNLRNMLKFNPSKTEIIQFSSRFSPAKPMLRLQSMIIMFSLLVLLKTLQSRLIHTPPLFPMSKTHWRSFHAHSRSFHAIGRIRKYLLQPDTERIVDAFSLSKLDNSNSLLHGIHSREVEKLQRLQNTATRLTVCMKKIDRTTTV